MTVVNDGQWDKIKAQAFKPDVVILNSPICIWKCSVGIRCVVASSSSISGKAAWLEAAAWLAAMWLPPCLGEVHSRSWCNTMASPFWEIKNTGKHPSNLSSILVNLHIHGVKVCKSGGYSCMWIKNTIHTLPTPLLACSDNVLKYQLCQLSSSKSHVHSHPTSQEKSTIKIGTRISMTQVPTGHSWKQDPSMLYHFNSIHLSMFIFPPKAHLLADGVHLLGYILPWELLRHIGSDGGLQDRDLWPWSRSGLKVVVGCRRKNYVPLPRHNSRINGIGMVDASWLTSMNLEGSFRCIFPCWGFLCQWSNTLDTHGISKPCLSWQLHTGTGDAPRVSRQKLCNPPTHLQPLLQETPLYVNPWFLQISSVISPGLPYSHPALWAERAIAAVSWASQVVVGAQKSQKETPKIKGCWKTWENCQSVSEVTQFQGNDIMINKMICNDLRYRMYKHHPSAYHLYIY